MGLWYNRKMSIKVANIMVYKTLIKAARLPFLALTPICILYAYSLATINNAEVSLPTTFVILVGALAAHLAVNFINEYQDFQSGLDLITIKTPFSGGSGALPNDPNNAKVVLFSGVLSLIVVAIVGIYLLQQSTGMLLVIGLVGLLIILTYTTWLNRMPIMCLLAPGLGFGTLMVLGSVFVLTHQISMPVIILSMVPFFQVNTLLLLNQYPDIDADKKVGRNHFPIAFGVDNSNLVYGLFMVIPFVIISVSIVFGLLPIISAIALLPLILGLMVFTAIRRIKSEIKEQPQFLAMNVVITLLTPLLLSTSLLIS
jgi:1,4-dihydroxy-2-naphthoate octaprenyltransferase